MSVRLPPLNALRAFEVAARHLSFTRAASELYVTQAAVSHQIKSLEDFLGIKLFLRRNRKLLLTEEGQRYYADIRDVFHGLHEATERLLASGEKGALTVSLPPSFATQWLVPRLHQFSTLHPDIDVRIKAVDFDEGFLNDDVDVAIYYGRGKWPGLHAEKLHTEYLTPMCSPIMLLKSGKPLKTLDDLKYHMLLHDHSRQGWKDWLRHFQVAGINANQGPVFSHTMLVLQAAAIGQGVALGHSVLARPDIEAGRLVCPFKERLVSKHAYYFVCQQSHAELGKIVAFRDWLLGEVEKEQAEESF
ncbi:transcriptional regulator GcvA [Bowmanella sp. JS7-9]|uniref:Transcriptional regulator GcvA n=1 Tax=Pseudobowmanella zhangzhouensis TaxID=1537679 RepID=A0ABW1XL05_9ALTE|nr:transcriptional regulator GcvA [Bowmanella sp. JS7-9]TBX27435.1 transcriptional regulator [Bowmanella sp. JS7-9]